MSDIDTDYIGAWMAPHNDEIRERLSGNLRRGEAVEVDFQPGDGTRYHFLLVPMAGQHTVSAKSAPSQQGFEDDVVYATIINGLGEGVGTFSRFHGGTMESIRHRIDDKMSVPNPCTREALAATILSLWM